MKRTNRINQAVTASVSLAALVAGTNALAWDLELYKNHSVTFHGFASQGFIASSDYNYLGQSSDGTARFTELGLNASYSPFERTRIAAQGFAFALGDVGEYQPFLDYASIEYTFNDYIGIRAGRVRRPGGIYNHIQDLDLARTSVLLPQGIYDARWRDFSTSLDGGDIFGSIPLGKGGSLSYEGYAGMMHLSDVGGISRLLQKSLAGVGKVDSFDSFLNAGIQLWWNTPVDGLRVGANVNKSFAFAYDYTLNMGPAGTAPSRAETDAPGMQYSVEYLWKAWTFQAEYYWLGLSGNDIKHFPAGVVAPVAVDVATTSSSHRDSWYVSAAYRFNKWFEAGTYYTEFYPNQGTRSGNSDNFQKDLALSLRFDPKDWWIIKIEGHSINGTALLQDNPANPVRTDNNWFMLAVKTTVSF